MPRCSSSTLGSLTRSFRPTNHTDVTSRTNLTAFALVTITISKSSTQVNVRDANGSVEANVLSLSPRGK
ncbi:hypothetical protein KM043_003709 [Ampulex compressa]|nr:hypothetical protein KM043_003709 [Ampulex compressa]